MKPQKIFVTKGNMAAIKCPHCGKVKNISVEKFKCLKHQLHIKCACLQTFDAELDFRQNYRKECNLKVSFKILPSKQIGGIGTIVNISRTGLRFLLPEEAKKLPTGTRLLLQFNLDDKACTEMIREVKIVNVSDNTIGCQYTDPDLYDKEMGFYLMP